MLKYYMRYIFVMCSEFYFENYLEIWVNIFENNKIMIFVCNVKYKKNLNSFLVFVWLYLMDMFKKLINSK